YKPITSGLVRVFDEKLDATTFFYTRGESRNIVPGRPPIPPGVPEFLGGRSLRVEPINLPVEASYPGLKAFFRREELAKVESAVVVAEGELADSRRIAEAGQPAPAAEAARLTLRVDEAKLASALSELDALRARIAADDVRYCRTSGDVGTMSRRAARAER